jgi:hypothetical protein
MPPFFDIDVPSRLTSGRGVSGWAPIQQLNNTRLVSDHVLHMPINAVAFTDSERIVGNPEVILGPRFGEIPKWKDKWILEWRRKTFLQQAIKA